MELSQDQFFKGVYNYRTEANGPVHTVPRFSYESGARLYDVIQFPFGTVYQVNGTSHLSSSPIHREILKNFGEQHTEWRSWPGVSSPLVKSVQILQKDERTAQ